MGHPLVHDFRWGFIASKHGWECIYQDLFEMLKKKSTLREGLSSEGHRSQQPLREQSPWIISLEVTLTSKFGDAASTRIDMCTHWPPSSLVSMSFLFVMPKVVPLGQLTN